MNGFSSGKCSECGILVYDLLCGSSNGEGIECSFGGGVGSSVGGGEGEGIVTDDRGTGCTSRSTFFFLFFDCALRFFLLIGPGIGAVI